MANRTAFVVRRLHRVTTAEIGIPVSGGSARSPGGFSPGVESAGASCSAGEPVGTVDRVGPYPVGLARGLTAAAGVRRELRPWCAATT